MGRQRLSVRVPSRDRAIIANATGSIFAQGWTPDLQKLVGGKQEAASLLKAVQAEYEKELAH